MIDESIDGATPLNWGGRTLDNVSQVRTDYISALRAADAGDLTPLITLYNK